jgi:hypothetical protein
VHPIRFAIVFVFVVAEEGEHRSLHGGPLDALCREAGCDGLDGQRREQEVLRADVVVPEFRGLVHRALEQPFCVVREPHVASSSRPALELVLGRQRDSVELDRGLERAA